MVDCNVGVSLQQSVAACLMYLLLGIPAGCAAAAISTAWRNVDMQIAWGVRTGLNVRTALRPAVHFCCSVTRVTKILDGHAVYAFSAVNISIRMSCQPWQLAMMKSSERVLQKTVALYCGTPGPAMFDMHGPMGYLPCLLTYAMLRDAAL